MIKSPLGSNLTISNFKETSSFTLSSTEGEVKVDFLSTLLSTSPVMFLLGIPK